MSTYIINDPDELSGFLEQSFEFQAFNHDRPSYNYSQADIGFSEPKIFTPRPANSYNPTPIRTQHSGIGELDELPLLDELEIYPQRIIEKSLAVLNPFHKPVPTEAPESIFQESDLAGPIAFCLTIAICLFLSGSKAHFSYIYGLSIISVLVMYFLISLMCDAIPNYVTILRVASILGYSILPIVWLSILNVFTSLNSTVGIVLSLGAIGLATSGSSRVFCLMTGDPQQRLLIAYPCALVYLIFTLLVLF